MNQLRTALVAAALVALAIGLGARSLGSDVYEGGEAREALVAREMLDTGDWILPLWNGSVVPSKPPLYHWLVAGAGCLSGAGVTPVTLRAPSAALAGVVVLLVFLAGLAWRGIDAGVFSALVLATTPQFVTQAANGRVDMTLCAAVVAAQLMVVAALRGDGRARVALGLCLGLAMLAKGPVGPGLVGLTALTFAARERRLQPVLGLVRPVPVFLFVLVAGSWYALAYLERGHDFLAKQIVSENGEAILGGERIAPRSPLFYLFPLVADGFPWILLLPWALARAWRAERPWRYAAVWATAGFVFFSLAPLKRAAYLLPLRPAIGLVIGWWLAERLREEMNGRGRWPRLARVLLVTAAVAVAAGVGAALGLATGVVPAAGLGPLAARHEIDWEVYRRALVGARGEVALLGAATVAGAALAACAVGRARWRGAVLATAGMLACATLLVRGVFVPARAAQKSIRPFALDVRARLAPDDRLALLTSDEEIPFIFYVGRHVPVLGAAGRKPPDAPPGWYVLDQDAWRAWRAPEGWDEVVRGPHVFSRHRRDLVLVRRR